MLTLRRFPRLSSGIYWSWHRNLSTNGEPTLLRNHDPQRSPRRTTPPPRVTVLDTEETKEKEALQRSMPSSSTLPNSSPLEERLSSPLPASLHRTYQATLEKPLPSPQHRSSSGQRVSKKKDTPPAYDPALVIQIDSRKKQIKLNPIQKELVWTARQKEYHNLLQRIVVCLQSHQSALEKCHTLLALHNEVIHHRLRLRTDTYEDIFHTFYAVAVQGRAQHSLQASTREVEGDALLEQEIAGTSAHGNLSLSTPWELRSPLAASHAVLSPSMVQQLWAMYRYLVDSGTKPSARILQYLMGILDRSLAVYRGNPSHLLLTEAKAHSLLMDADRHHLTPSEFTVNAYIGVCDAGGVLHLATARVTDYLTRHERQPSPGLYTRLLCGLVRHHQYDDALSVVSTLQNVAMTTHLLNAVLHVARYSKDPLSAFSFYRAVLPTSSRKYYRAARGPQLRPSLHTFSILLEVMREQEAYGELNFVLTEMKYFGVKGNGLVLNRLVELFRCAGRTREAQLLMKEMSRKGLLVFDEHYHAVQS